MTVVEYVGHIINIFINCWATCIECVRDHALLNLDNCSENWYAQILLSTPTIFCLTGEGKKIKDFHILWIRCFHCFRCFTSTPLYCIDIKQLLDDQYRFSQPWRDHETYKQPETLVLSKKQIHLESKIFSLPIIQIF